MNTPPVRFVAALAVASIVAVTSGCGANTVGMAGDSTNAVASVETQDATTPGTSEAGVVEEAPEVVPGPVVKKSDRALPPLRPEIAEVVTLVNSGAGEEVVRTFVSVSSVPYDLSLEEIIYLRDIGLPDSVIAAMMRRGSELRAQEAEAAAMQTNLLATVEQLKGAIAEGAAANGSQGNAPESGQADVSGEAPPAPTSTSATPVSATQAPADAPEPVQQFYSDLSPYGTWYQVPTYGWVWQPSVVVVNPTWLPYRHGGRWVWTDCGWYWSSDYSWGWAPFHYGRWCTYPGLGWCWQPGTVWGPSWVTWRHHGSYVGWAPLPPACGWTSGVGLTWYGSSVSVGFSFGLSSSCYTFVSHRDFCHRNVGHHAVSGHHVDTVYRESTTINNVIVGNNNTIINNGVGYDRIAQHVRGEVPKATVHDLPNESLRTVRADRMERSKDGYVVYRPTQVEPTAGKPAAIRSEVRPASAASSLAGRGGAPMASPARPNYGSRYGSDAASTPGGVAGKPVGGRGSSSVAVPSASVPSGMRPTAPSSRAVSTPTPRPVSRTGAASAPAAKPAETRGTVPDPGRFGPSPRSSPSSSDSLLGPKRQTTPVPLADPSRNIPARPQTSTARSTPVGGSSAVPGKTSVESRSQGQRGYTVPTAPARGYSAPAPSAVTPSQARPSARPSTSVPSRSTVPSMTAPSAPTAPRPTYSAPAPAMSAPRPQFSAPAPAMSAPRPSFSAPAPAASRPAVSAPAPSAGAPGSSSSRGGARTQAN